MATARSRGTNQLFATGLLISVVVVVVFLWQGSSNNSPAKLRQENELMRKSKRSLSKDFVDCKNDVMKFTVQLSV